MGSPLRRPISAHRRAAIETTGRWVGAWRRSWARPSCWRGFSLPIAYRSAYDSDAGGRFSWADPTVLVPQQAPQPQRPGWICSRPLGPGEATHRRAALVISHCATRCHGGPVQRPGPCGPGPCFSSWPDQLQHGRDAPACATCTLAAWPTTSLQRKFLLAVELARENSGPLGPGDRAD